MAANKQTLELPNHVVNSGWKDDVDVDYAIYGNNEKEEGEYISPNTIDEKSAEQIKEFQVKIAFGGLKRFRQKELAKLAA